MGFSVSDNVSEKSGNFISRLPQSLSSKFHCLRDKMDYVQWKLS